MKTSEASNTSVVFQTGDTEPATQGSLSFLDSKALTATATFCGISQDNDLF